MFILFLLLDYWEDRLLVCFKKDVNIEIINSTKTNITTINQLIKKYNVYHIERWLSSAGPQDYCGDIHFSKIYRLKLKGNLFSAIKEFSKDKNVLYAELEPKNKLLYRPNDPYFGHQWFIPKVKADSAWMLWDIPNELPGDTTIIIGIIDTGIDWYHPDLIDNIHQNLKEDADRDGRTIECIDGKWRLDEDDLNNWDDDGNGYEDDLIGWDFGDNDNNPAETGNHQDIGHGSWVAGIAAAVTDNYTGIASISFRAKILCVKCVPDAGYSGVETGYDGILYAAKMGARIINCSWGSPYYSGSAERLINMIYNNYNAVICGGAGNDSTSRKFYPAAYKNVIAVAATDKNDKKAKFSNYGDWIDVCAPGVDILGTGPDGNYWMSRGTSAASPVAASCFALLKSAFPNFINRELEEKILNSCDNIDALNPGYAGRLGRGRINIFKAIGGEWYPSLTYVSRTIEELIGDNDGIINPGETIIISIEIKNEKGWQPANDVVGILSSQDPYIEMIDSIANYGDIPAGANATNTPKYKLKIKNTAPVISKKILNLKLTANQTSTYPYYKTLNLEIEVSFNQKGWPKKVGGIVSPPAIIDIDQDGSKEIIAGDNGGKLWIWSYDGNVKHGFPITTEGEIKGAPAIGKIDNDFPWEIVVGSTDKNLYIIEPNGNIQLKYSTQNSIMGTPALMDLDQNDDGEIVFGDIDGNLYVINHDGSNFSPFPYKLDGKIFGGVAIGDINSDGVLDIVVATFNKKIYAISINGDTLDGFPVSLSGKISATPSIADFNKDGKKEIVIGCLDGSLYILNCYGDTVTKISVGARIQECASFCDIDGDDTLDIVFGSNDGKIYAYKYNGTPVSGFPYSTGAIVISSPSFSDLDGDGTPEIVVGSNNGYLYLLRTDGTEFIPPINTGAPIQSSACIEHLDNDEDLEIAIGNSSGMTVIDYKTKGGRTANYWNTYRRIYRRTGCYEDSLFGLEDWATVKLENWKLWQNKPNPFIGKTIIQYSIPTKTMVRLAVYDKIGRLVCILVDEKKEPGIYKTEWEPKNVESGVYFYRLYTPQKEITKKMIFIRR